jgi:hypothetical protein
MRKYFLLQFLSCSILSALAQHQERVKYITASIINAHTAKPFGSFTRLCHQDFHPGMEIGAGLNWKTKPKHDWFQEVRFGYFYHRWVQHSFSLYTEAGYRYKLPLNIAIEARLGAGYTRVIVANQVFADGYDKERKYTKITSGRSQAIFTTSFGINKTIIKGNDTRVFFQYQQRIQTPFVRSYVPLLPYNIAMLGVNIPLHSKTPKH